MCKCTPSIRTPFCGKMGCEWPKERKFRCGECGSRNIHLRNVKGRSFPYMKFSALKIEVDLFLHVCNDCDNYIQIGGDGAKIDSACRLTLEQGGFHETA